MPESTSIINALMEMLNIKKAERDKVSNKLLRLDEEVAAIEAAIKSMEMNG